MIHTQCKLMFLKRGFRISFSLMLAFAFLFPFSLMLMNHLKGNDISAIPDCVYAYLFCSYFFAKAIACMVGGFVIFFVPLSQLSTQK